MWLAFAEGAVSGLAIFFVIAFGVGWHIYKHPNKLVKMAFQHSSKGKKVA